MAITKEYLRRCKRSVGGIKEVYLFSYIPYSRKDITITEHLLLEFPNNAIYRIQGLYNASFSENATESPRGYEYQQGLSLSFSEIGDYYNFTQIVEGLVRAVVLDNNGNYWLIGCYNGLDVTSYTRATGGTKSELNGYTITLAGAESVEAPQLKGLADIFKYNTDIGGEGANTTTSQELASLLQININDISFFEVVDGNIRAFIDVPYSIPTGAFQNNTDITGYEDLSGNVVSIAGSAFQDSTVGGDLVFRGLVSFISTSQFRNCVNITSFSCGVTSISNQCFNGATALNSFATIDTLTNVGDSAFINTAITNINLNNVTNIGFACFQDSALNKYLRLNSLLTLGNNAFFGSQIKSFSSATLLVIGNNVFNNTNLTDVNLDTDCPLVTSIGTGAYRNSTLIYFVGNNLTSIGDSSFRDTNIASFEAKNNALLIGTTTGNNNVFENAPTGGIATVDIVQQTADGGAVEGDILYLENTKGWTVNYTP